MHRSAQTAVNAGGTSEDFGQGAIEHKAHGQITGRGVWILFDDSQANAFGVTLHHLEEAGFVELADGRKTLGQDLAMTAV